MLDLLPEYVMNAGYTNAPRRWRAGLYRTFVRLCGTAIRDRVQRAGRADTLVCLAVIDADPYYNPNLTRHSPDFRVGV